MNAFVEMLKLVLNNAGLFQRLDKNGNESICFKLSPRVATFIYNRIVWK